jgi:hypothetical protein
MANPNIVNVADIRGKTSVVKITSTGNDLVTNSSGSNDVYKINSLYVSNVGASAETVSVLINRSAVDYHLAYEISVPINASINIIDKNTSVYIEEGDVLKVIAGNNNFLEAVCSYEIISDV